MRTSSYSNRLQLLVAAGSDRSLRDACFSFSQTKISYHSNKYKPLDDVKVGRQAAAEVEQQMPISTTIRLHELCLEGWPAIG